VVLAGVASCYGDTLLFATNGAGQFGTIDVTTGIFAQIGGLEPSTLWGLGWDGYILYGLTSQANPDLDIINPSTGAITTVGATGLSKYSIMSSTIGGALYAIDGSSSKLYTINPATGAAVFVANTGLPTGIGNYYDSMAGSASNLYVTLNQTLYIVNPLTGATTDVGNMSTTHVLGSAWVNNQLYGFTDSASQPFYIINTGNAQMTFAGDATVDVYFATPNEAPEPGTVWLLCAGIIGLGAARLRLPGRSFDVRRESHLRDGSV